MTQEQALEILKSGQNVFLTGEAGSGKTYLLREYISYLQSQGVGLGITASTGIAATHMNGMTIHSWCGIGIKDSLSQKDLEQIKTQPGLEKRILETKVLIIDEISMLHHFRLDLIDDILKFIKDNELPFGGMQVVFCGDFFQLPPVSRFGEEKALFAYHANSWKDLDLQICYLEEQHRQKDDNYSRILNSIRENRFSQKEYELLHERYQKESDSDISPIKLYSHNANVDDENERELLKLDGEMYSYEMTGKGKRKLSEALAKNCLAPETLRLKVGAKVMFVKNNFDKGYVNGTLGIVESCNNFEIKVRTSKGKLIDVIQATWMIEENGEIKAEITQYPLRLAWAITVHKSQGMTMDYAQIDLANCFERGMGYVALSRVSSLSGLTMMGLNDTATKVNEEVLEIDKIFRKTSSEQLYDFLKYDREERERIQNDFLQKVGATGKKLEKKEKVDTYKETIKLLEKGLGLDEIAQARNLKRETIISHLEKVKDKRKDLDLSTIQKEIKPLRLALIKKVFLSLEKINDKYPLSPAKEILGDDYSYEEVRLGRLLL